LIKCVTTVDYLVSDPLKEQGELAVFAFGLGNDAEDAASFSFSLENAKSINLPAEFSDPIRNPIWNDAFYEAEIGSIISVTYSFQHAHNNAISLEEPKHFWVHYGDITGGIEIDSLSWERGGALFKYKMIGALPSTTNAEFSWNTMPGTAGNDFIKKVELPRARLHSADNRPLEIFIDGNELKAPFYQGYLIAKIGPLKTVNSIPREALLRSLKFNTSLEIVGRIQSSDGRLLASDDAAEKNAPYTVVLEVKNLSPLRSKSVKADWSKTRRGGTKPIINPGANGGAVLIPEIEHNGSAIVALGNFRHNWEWIPEENPLIGIEALIDLNISLFNSFSEGFFKTIVKSVRKLTAFSTWGAAYQLYDFFISTATLVSDSEPSSSYRFEVKLSDEISIWNSTVVGKTEFDVPIDVSDDRMAALIGYVAAKLTADLALGSAIAALFTQPVTTVAGIATAVSFLQVAKLSYAVAMAAYIVAKDPPDNDYATDVRVNRTAPVIGSTRTSEFDRVFLLTEIAAFRDATFRARNKADGADLAGDYYWHSRQLLAASGFSFAASQLEEKLALLDGYYATDTPELTQDYTKTISDRFSTEGLPDSVEQALRDAGMTTEEIHGFLHRLISVKTLPAIKATEVIATRMLSSVSYFLESADLLIAGTRLRVGQLNEEVLPVSDDDLVKLTERDIDISRGFESELANSTYKEIISRQLEHVYKLIQHTGNLHVLEPYLDRATSAYMQSISRYGRIEDIAEFVSQQQSLGIIGQEISTALQSRAQSTAEALRENSTEAAISVKSFLQHIASLPNESLPDSLKTLISGSVKLASSPSQLKQDSYTLEVGREFRLGIMSNDECNMCQIVKESLFIESGMQGLNSNAVIAGEIALTPTYEMLGKHEIIYSVLDDLRYMRNTQVAVIEVVPSFFQNPSLAFDVNDDSFVTPLDALLILNDLSRNGARPTDKRDGMSKPYIDVDGNRQVAPLDSLLVLNYIGNKKFNSESNDSEGEDYEIKLSESNTQAVDAYMTDFYYSFSQVDEERLRRTRRSLC
jgi:hypothetical protein